MRALIAVSAFLVCILVQALDWNYFAARKWVEEQCGTNAPPQPERLFVGRFASPKYAAIIPFHRGMTLREIIDQTPLKGKVVFVCAMWPDYLKTGPFTRHAYIRVRPSENPDYEVKSLDVIWLYDDGPLVDT
jgi:hypothetical protein